MRPIRPILKIGIPFILGISIGLMATITYGLEWLQKAFMGAVAFALSALFLHLLVWILKKQQSAFHYIFWFCMGGLLALANNPLQNPKHFSHVNADTFIAQVNQVHLSKSKQTKFIRTELDMHYAFLDNKKREVTGKIIVFIDTSAWKDFKRNDRLIFHGVPEAISNNGNPGEFDLQLFWRTKGFTHQLFLGALEIELATRGNASTSIFEKMNSGISAQLERHLTGDVFAVALGVLLGDKSYLNLKLKDAFSGAGAMHLLAVSGLHVGIFLFLLQWLFKNFAKRTPRWLQFTIILAILWTYAGITGFSPSVNRAVTMFSFVAIGTLSGKRYDSVNGLLASAILLLFINPYFLFDIGFQLSYSAMLGIFLFSPLIEKSFYIKNKWLRFIWSGTAVALAAQLTTFPLTLYYFHQFPNYFLITNIGLMLISFTMMAIGLGLITLGNIPLIGQAVAFLFVVVVSALVYFVQWISTLPYAITRGFRISLWEMALLYLALALLLYAILHVQKKALYISLLLFLGFIAFQSYQSINDRLTHELLILNSDNPSFFVRRGQQADLIVVSNKEDIADKTQFILRSLDVYYGVNTKAHYLPRKKGHISTSIEGLSMDLRSGMIHVNFNEQTHAYLYGDYFKPDELPKAQTILFGTWLIPSNIELPETTAKRWWLKEKGAFRLKLK